MEISTITRSPTGEVEYHILDKVELEKLLAEAQKILKEEAAKESAADI
jgi:hypothetical protein